MKRIGKYISERWKGYLAIGLLAASIVCVLLDIVEHFKVTLFYSPYIICAPVLLALIIRIFVMKKEKSRGVKELCFALGLSAVEYLFLILSGKMSFHFKLKVVVYMVTALYLLVFLNTQNDELRKKEEAKSDNNEKKIFSLYYINTEKVYEIAMLLNNRIVTSGTSENQAELSIDKQTNIGISSNLNYLETVKGELGVSQNSQMHNGIKKKVLENFDVKTTKSNMLASIIAKANEYKANDDIDLGDLVLLKNASLELLNAEESYAVTKMVLNGAFKDTKISSDSDDMKIEFDLSAMINSVLKDCAYELGCIVDDKKFLLTIPMTFENDFENSYNIYDLQVGTVTVVGIYRGKRKYEKRLSLQEIFSGNSEQKKDGNYDSGDYQLISSLKNDKEVFDDIANKNKHSEEFKEVIDVIAVIQEINAN